MLDADLQDPPEAIPELLRAKEASGAAIAFASRTGVYARGVNMTGRGTWPGLITYNPGPADSTKK